MARSRVSSFLSTWSHPTPHSHAQKHDSTSSAQGQPPSPEATLPLNTNPSTASATNVSTPAQNVHDLHDFSNNNNNTPSPTPPRARATPGSRPSSRPASMVQTYQPPLMEVANDTPPELQPVFTFLNSHSNKLYQEGYFLKLHDLDSRGRPSADRTWQECFAQLVGTVLSIWDAAELDGAGEDGEVVPTFINLADASIKMIESLPMSERGGQNLQNVLSVSTAANNRYLLHFNTLNSLTQWTAGIRLAMYEHATLQEAYTGSLIAGKGKLLNNIRAIMERARMPYEDWARVRFGAGTPWRRCWFVISPPDEKEYQKVQKAMKKKNPYDKMPVLKGDLKFYETKKITKKTRPIATITHAYSAYAIYPQSKPLIDQSTLVKLEAKITIHSNPESISEGFVFVMPETHPAVSGFEMMLRFLFPVWDTFNLYGRPNRLIADVLDQRGLMFAMPKDRRYGYLELLDVAGLIHTDGSATWPEHQWRRQLKELTSKRMLTMADDDTPRDRKSMSRISLPASGRGSNIRFDESGRNSPVTAAEYAQPRRTDTAPPGQSNLQHRRSASETNGLRPYQRDIPSRFGQSPSPNPYSEGSQASRPHPHRQPGSGGPLSPGMTSDSSSDRTGGRNTPELDPSPDRPIPPEVQAMAARSPPPGPVHAPPVFNHAPSQKPATKPNQAPELRRGQSDLDQATLSQMAEASRAQGNPRSPPQADFGGYGRDPYASRSGNGYQSGYDDRGRGPTSQPGGSPADYPQRDYQRSVPNHKTRAPQGTRLQTIPASPYVQQDSPVTPHGTRMQQQDYFPQQQPAAQNPAVAGLAAAGVYSRSNPDLRNEVQPYGGASGSDPNLGRKAPQENPYASREPLVRNPASYGNVSRKPVHGSPEQRQEYGQRRDMQGQGHPEWPTTSTYQQYPPQSPYGQQGNQSNRGQGPPYQQQQQQGGYQQQQQRPPNAPMHGQLPVRGPPPHQQQYPPQQQQQQSAGRGGQWI